MREIETGKWLTSQTNKEYVKLMAEKPTSDTAKKQKQKDRTYSKSTVVVFVVGG